MAVKNAISGQDWALSCHWSYTVGYNLRFLYLEKSRSATCEVGLQSIYKLGSSYQILHFTVKQNNNYLTLQPSFEVDLACLRIRLFISIQVASDTNEYRQYLKSIPGINVAALRREDFGMSELW